MHAVQQVLPKYLSAPQTRPEVIARLERGLLRVPGERAAAFLEPLYRCELQQAVRRWRRPGAHTLLK